MSDLIITNHAYDMAKERLSWKPKTLDRMIDKILVNGITHKETKGKLKKYVSSKYAENKTANNVLIHGYVVYIICNKYLITLYQLPKQYESIVDKIKETKNVKK